MNCPRIKKSGKPAGWIHSLFCTECRSMKRTDDLLAFGIVQLRKQPGEHAALNRTLSALSLPPLPANHRAVRRRRHKIQVRSSAMAASALGAFGWLYYMNWLPAAPKIAPMTALHHGYKAFAAAKDAIIATPEDTSKEERGLDKLAKNVSTLETRDTVGPMQEAVNIGRFLEANAHALELVRADLTTPYREPFPSTLKEEWERPSLVAPLSAMLHADAAWKYYRGDHTGALHAALDLMNFGMNVSGGGSMSARHYGNRSLSYGRMTLWRLLPQMSAEEARQTCRELERLDKVRVPLRETLVWEHASGLVMRRDLMSDPMWRWHAGATFGSNSPNLGVALTLHAISNHRVLANYDAYMDAVEDEISGAYTPISHVPPIESPDLINAVLTPVYNTMQFTDLYSQTQNALLKTELALHAYRLEHGVDAPNLDALCPNYLDYAPIDPFQSGSTLHYTLESSAKATALNASYHGDPAQFRASLRSREHSASSTYLLYSVGPDGVDEHGEPITDGSSFSVNMNSAGDIVAGVNL